jgi:DNA repair exonuclease SbcCD ATPase subunit
LFAVKAEKQSIMDDLKAVRDKKSTLDNAKEKLYRLENQIKEAGSEEKADELRDEKNSNIEKMQEALVKYNEKSEKHKTELEALKNKLTDLVREQSTISTKKRELELAESEAKSDQKHIESLQKMIDDQNDDIEKAKDKKESLSKTVLKFKDISDYLNAIKDILKDENIKQYTIKQIMPFLNKQVNYYLSEVNYGFYVKIDKWLDVDIKGPGIRNATYGNLSGGERRGIDISLQLSLLDVSRSQAGIFPDLLVLDELLDSSIDARGIHELMKIIKFKQKEFDGKIFVISHRDEIDGDLIDYLYKAVKKDGFSEIVY